MRGSKQQPYKDAMNALFAGKKPRPGQVRHQHGEDRDVKPGVLYAGQKKTYPTMDSRRTPKKKTGVVGLMNDVKGIMGGRLP